MLYAYSHVFLTKNKLTSSKIRAFFKEVFTETPLKLAIVPNMSIHSLSQQIWKNHVLAQKRKQKVRLCRPGSQ